MLIFREMNRLTWQIPIKSVLQKKIGLHVLNSYYLLIICLAFLVGGRSL